MGCSAADDLRSSGPPDVAVWRRDGGGLSLARWLEEKRAKAGPLAALADARARWKASGVKDYRITARYGGMEPCEQDYEIREGRHVAIKTNTCSWQPQDVAGLFNFVEKRIAADEGACGPNGCCQILRVEVTYSMSLGYPERMNTYPAVPAERLSCRYEAGTRGEWGAFSGGFMRCGLCTLIGFPPRWGLESVAVTPLR